MLKDYFQENEEKIKTEIEKSVYRRTSKALLRFYEKSLSIFNVVNMVNFERDFYPCVILIRCQIEHFIVTSYIWIQFRIQENDKIAAIYYEEYLLQEIFKRINYSKQNNVSNSSIISIVFQKILDVLTEKQIIKQKHIQKINLDANQFDIRTISKFYDKTLPLEFDNVIKKETIKEFLDVYNFVSSFVHGGPTADAIFGEKDIILTKENIIYFKELSKNIVAFHRFFIIYFLAMNNKEIESDMKIELNKIV